MRDTEREAETHTHTQRSRDTERERERGRGRGRSRPPCREPDAGLDPGTPGSRPGPQAAPNHCATGAAP